ncbi:sugar ABC transporter ATP-binding protein [Microbacterium sp. KRD172]|uniref:sugar ABC transporter ATP-binding protein n=1 Tax=Microbacterium sp. KRD172 TaxID=2729727 RepID=UPI0019D0EDF6|nr:sugar ABC transporter ATP-binding protein [Microbacterium sp. KRD172]
MTVPLLRLDGINKSFFGNAVLTDVSFEITRGEIVSLVGTNGAGKSTLSSVIAGIHPPNSGVVQIDGERVQLRTPRDAERHGIGMVHQEPTLVDQLTVHENIFLNRELLTPARTLRRGAMIDESRAVLESLGYQVDPEALVRNLPLIERGVVAIARAMLARPRILILDEVTATLNAKEVEHLFTVIRQIAGSGVGVIFIGHDMREVVEISNRVVVVRDGQIGGVLSTGDGLNEATIIRIMLGATGEMQDDLAKDTDPTLSDPTTRTPLLSTRWLSLDEVYDDVSFEVCAGEVVGLAGLKGAGITELLFTLFGAYRPTSGEIMRADVEIHPRNPREAIMHGIGMVTNDRQAEGLALGLSIADNVVLATLRRFARWLGTASGRDIDAAARESINRLSIKTTGPYQKAQFLSGGNQQKVVVAKWLQRDVDVLLVDEPTRGVDVRAKREIYDLLLEERERGKGIVVYSPEIRELLTLADRILVFAHGKMVDEIVRGDAAFTEQGLLEVVHSGRSASTAVALDLDAPVRMEER